MRVGPSHTSRTWVARHAVQSRHHFVVYSCAPPPFDQASLSLPSTEERPSCWCVKVSCRRASQSCKHQECERLIFASDLTYDRHFIWNTDMSYRQNTRFFRQRSRNREENTMYVVSCTPDENGLVRFGFRCSHSERCTAMKRDWRTESLFDVCYSEIINTVICFRCETVCTWIHGKKHTGSAAAASGNEMTGKTEQISLETWRL